MVPVRISESKNLVTEKRHNDLTKVERSSETPTKNRTQRHSPQPQRQRMLTEPLNVTNCADGPQGPPDIEGLVLLAPLLSVQVLGQTSANVSHQVL